MPTTTTNFAFENPIPLNNIDANVWGDMLNGNMTALDAYLTDNTSNFLGSAAPVLGDTVNPIGGQFWVNNSVSTSWPLKIYDGTTWVLVGTINTTAHTFTTPSTASSINVQTFTSSDTYTPSANLSYAIVEVQGGGGGAGYVNVGCAWASGGCGGGYAKECLSASAIGSPVAVTVGTGGAGGATTSAAGVAGGTSSFGAFLSATGGSGGATSATVNVGISIPGTPGIGSGGNINLPGGFATAGTVAGGISNSGNYSAGGGNGIYGTGGASWVRVPSSVGSTVNGVNAAANTGGGGSSGANYGGSGGACIGGNGAAGIVIVTEYIG